MFRFGAFEEPNAVGKEGEVEGNDEATVGDDALFSKGGTNDGVAEKSGVVENKSKLRLSGKGFLPKILIENEFGEKDERKHDNETGEKAEEEEIEKLFAGGSGKGGEERGRHEDREKKADEFFVGGLVDEILFA